MFRPSKGDDQAWFAGYSKKPHNGEGRLNGLPGAMIQVEKSSLVCLQKHEQQQAGRTYCLFQVKATSEYC